ncbi:hypothetical protein LRP49_24080 [Enterovibrio sp. ZSDZ35]|uniref:Transposase n=1 Tax=Enterovibrio qingdaonensis TaxID=2899818 RepID=A0ABT5QUJ4_9GAMM|nr:hypothetical protein [Enterovibrio sp. ZSDZ35]MDD1784259.1 hypothetical protein [Enterovibrio sp. ZSDZ35]
MTRSRRLVAPIRHIDGKQVSFHGVYQYATAVDLLTINRSINGRYDQ